MLLEGTGLDCRLWTSQRRPCFFLLGLLRLLILSPASCHGNRLLNPQTTKALTVQTDWASRKWLWSTKPPHEPQSKWFQPCKARQQLGLGEEVNNRAVLQAAQESLWNFLSSDTPPSICSEVCDSPAGPLLCGNLTLEGKRLLLWCCELSHDCWRV